MTTPPGPILITGVSGTIGSHLAAELAVDGTPLRLLDLRPPAVVPSGAEFVQADLRDLNATVRAVAGAAAIIHLAGVTHETAWTTVLEHNIIGGQHLLEAARCHRVPRVVLASSHHVTGLTPTDATRVDGDRPLAPDSYYAVSKITLEALGQLYSHKAGLEVVAVRIGSHRIRPTEPRHRATWLSPRDTVTLLRAAATRPLPTPFLTVYGTSDTPARWWPRSGWETLHYQPTDTAAEYPNIGPLKDRWQGGAFADLPLP